MIAKNKAQAYRKLSVETASPARIVLMLYEGMLRFMEEAAAAIDEPDDLRRIERINNRLIRAQNIISELQGNLDFSVGGDIPQTLYDLYDFWFRQLSKANLEKTREPIDTILPQVTEIRDAWDQMLKQHASGGQAAPAGTAGISQTA